MVSFITVLKKLMESGEEYRTGIGYPESKWTFQEFISKITDRIPELAGSGEREIEDTVLAAIDFAIENHCKAERVFERGPPGYVDYMRTVKLYSCHHPHLGRFYMLVEEVSDAQLGNWSFRFRLSKDAKELEEAYKEKLSALGVIF